MRVSSFAWRSRLCLGFLSILFLSFAGGCVSDLNLDLPIQRPAEINMAGRTHVVLEDITGKGGDVITSRLKDSLQGKFTLLDRGALQRRIQESSINQGDSSNDADRPGIMQASVLIRGKVIRHDLTQRIESATSTSNGVQSIGYRAVGAANLEASIDVVELATTEIIKTSSIKVSEPGTTAYYSNPPQLAGDPLFDNCYNNVVAEFMRKIASYDQIITVTVYEAKGVAENANGIASFVATDYKRAANEFSAAIAAAKTMPKVKPELLGKIAQNAGLAYEWSRQYSAAIKSYDEADRLAPGKGYGAAGRKRIQQRIEDEKNLANQGAAAER